MTRRQAERIGTAIRIFGDAQFEAGEWRRDESEEPYDRVNLRVYRAENRLRRVVGLPPLRAPNDPTCGTCGDDRARCTGDVGDPERGDL